MSRFFHSLRTSLLVLGLALILVGCAPNPMERTIDRLDSLVVLLETHKDDPETMLSELESFIADHKAEWAEDRDAIDALDLEEQQRLEAKYERELQTVIGRLYDVSLEIQVDLEDRPELRSRFVHLIQSIE